MRTIRDKLQMYVVTSSVCLCLILLAGHLMRRKSLWLRALHMPASVIGGLFGWVLFALVEVAGGEALADEWFQTGWDVLPSFCTNIVFCCLFLGAPVPRASVVLRSPVREHLIYGLVVVFGQYATSALVTSVVRLADPSLPAQFATVMPYGCTRAARAAPRFTPR